MFFEEFSIGSCMYLVVVSFPVRSRMRNIYVI